MADADTLDSLARLIDIVARLRAPGGCPWDREQTPESLRPYLVEEAYEVLDAIDRGDLDGQRDELGDVLLQVVFHAEIASERGQFRLADVARATPANLVRPPPARLRRRPGARRRRGLAQLAAHQGRRAARRRSQHRRRGAGVGPGRP